MRPLGLRRARAVVDAAFRAGYFLPWRGEGLRVLTDTQASRFEWQHPTLVPAVRSLVLDTEAPYRFDVRFEPASDGTGGWRPLLYRAQADFPRQRRPQEL